MTPRFDGRLGLQQRVLPSYRSPFFDLLAGSCQGGMSVFAGTARPGESIGAGTLRVAHHSPANNQHLFSGPLYLCRQTNILQWLESWEPQVLLMEANPRYLSTPDAVQWMHERGRKVVGWGLGAPRAHGVFSHWVNDRRRRFVSQFDALIAYSTRGASEYAALGFPRTRIFTASNAVASRPTHEPVRSPDPAKATVLFVGRLQGRKRVDLLIQACAAITPSPRLVVVGDGPELPHLQKLANRVFPATEFAGPRHGAELEPYFSAADLLVLPGTGGLAVQDGMAHGLPVIVAQGDGTQDDLVKSENGWQVRAGDLADLTHALRTALADRAYLARMGDASLRLVNAEANIEHMVEVFVGALNSLS